MYIIQYDTNIKDYIAYDLSLNILENIMSNDNGFYQIYPNNENIIIRLHFKIELFILKYEEPHINYMLEKIFNYINSNFNTINNDWLFYINEKNIKETKKFSVLFFSTKYCILLKDLRILIDRLYTPLCNFDLSIYYPNNKNNIISLPLANQSNYKYKYSNIYRLEIGSYSNTLVMNNDNLILYISHLNM
jgi:hypothetical protein